MRAGFSSTAAEGVAKRVDRAGDGVTAPKEGSTLYVHFTCRLADAPEPAVIDTSRGDAPSNSGGITVLKQNQPLKCRLGDAAAIAGWTAALRTMSLGERSAFIIDADMAYGAAGKGAVPPDAALEYDLELVGVDGRYFTGS